MYSIRSKILITTGCLSLLAQGLLAVHSHQTDTNIYLFMGIHLILFILLLVALRFTIDITKTKEISLIIGFAIAMRIIAAFAYPYYEDDFHRYLWDGKVWHHKINPYQYPPDDFFLTPLRDQNWSNINFKSIPTIYPPLAQFLFYLSYYLKPNSLLMLKALLLLFDILTIGVVILILKKIDRNIGTVILYAWNPLVIKEFANSAHVDTLAVFMLSLFFLLALKPYRGWATVALGGAILAKLYPIVLIPALIRFFRLRDFVLLVTIILAGYSVFWDVEELVFQGLATYTQHWEYNDSGFVFLSIISALFTSEPMWWSKIIVILGLGLIGIRKAQHVKRGGEELLHTAFVLIGLLLIFAPTVAPWYLTWIIPLLCVFPRASWITLNGTMFLSYFFYLHNQDLWWIRTAEYTPFFALLCWEMIQRIKNKTLTKELTYEKNSVPHFI